MSWSKNFANSLLFGIPIWGCNERCRFNHLLLMMILRHSLTICGQTQRNTDGLSSSHLEIIEELQLFVLHISFPVLK